jgi:hypothetical protein
VSLPTFIVVDGKEVLMRIAGRLPTTVEINLLEGIT